MKLGIFSKMGASGGSEHRCIEMANAIVRNGHQCYLFAEHNISTKVSIKLDPAVLVLSQTCGDCPNNKEKFYEIDSLLVVNTDSTVFCKLEYWEQNQIDVSKIPQMVFLFNYVLGPAKELITLKYKCKDVRIICANKLFYNQLSESSRFGQVIYFPRITLDSPIDPNSISAMKHPTTKIRIGKHSKTLENKFNSEHIELIEYINKRFKNLIEWDFMGVPKARKEKLQRFDNVTIREEYSISVKEYLKGIDIFLFFIDWKRNEPWSRSVAEGMMSGCPIIANNKAGNQDQIIHSNNGFLCDNLNDFKTYLCYLCDEPEKIKQMGDNSRIYSMQYLPEVVFNKFLSFIKCYQNV